MTYKEEIKSKLDRLNRKICCVNKDIENLLSENVTDALNNASNPSLTNVFLTEDDLSNYLPQDVIDALTGANTPTALNTYVTQSDLSSLPDAITVVANYAALPLPNTVTGQFFWAEASQGTQWLPGSLGGTYYPLGIYYSNGAVWTHIETPYQATQAEVNTGTNTTKFVTPETLKLSTQWDGVVLLAGRTGGQIINGGTGAGENLTLMSTSNGTKGNINFGTSTYDEVNNRLGINTTSFGSVSHSYRLSVGGNIYADRIYSPTFRDPASGNDWVVLSGTSPNQVLSIGNAGVLTNNFTTKASGSNFNFINGSVNLTPSTLTGSSATSALSISQTWNTTGSPTAIDLNITDTASNAASLFMNLRRNESSVFRVTKLGGIVTSGLSLFNNNCTFNTLLDCNSVNNFRIVIPNATKTLLVNHDYTNSPSASAIFELQSTTQGFLPPRMTSTQASAIASPAQGLMLFVTDTNATFTSIGWWGFNGTIWTQL